MQRDGLSRRQPAIVPASSRKVETGRSTGQLEYRITEYEALWMFVSLVSAQFHCQRSPKKANLMSYLSGQIGVCAAGSVEVNETELGTMKQSQSKDVEVIQDAIIHI